MLPVGLLRDGLEEAGQEAVAEAPLELAPEPEAGRIDGVGVEPASVEAVEAAAAVALEGLGEWAGVEASPAHGQQAHRVQHRAAAEHGVADRPADRRVPQERLEHVAGHREGQLGVARVGAELHRVLAAAPPGEPRRAARQQLDAEAPPSLPVLCGDQRVEPGQDLPREAQHRRHAAGHELGVPHDQAALSAGAERGQDLVGQWPPPRAPRREMVEQAPAQEGALAEEARVADGDDAAPAEGHRERGGLARAAMAQERRVPPLRLHGTPLPQAHVVALQPTHGRGMADAHRVVGVAVHQLVVGLRPAGGVAGRQEVDAEAAREDGDGHLVGRAARVALEDADGPRQQQPAAAPHEARDRVGLARAVGREAVAGDDEHVVAREGRRPQRHLAVGRVVAVVGLEADKVAARHHVARAVHQDRHLGRVVLRAHGPSLPLGRTRTCSGSWISAPSSARHSAGWP